MIPNLGDVTENIAVLTTCRGTHDALLRQIDGLATGSLTPRLHVAISMGDRDLTRGRLPLSTDRWETIVKPVQTDHRSVPVAAARNLAAQIAVEEGAEVLLFLECEMIPGSRTLERFYESARSGVEQSDGPVLWIGNILDLPEPQPLGVPYPMGRLHEIARPSPEDLAGLRPLAPGELDTDHPWDAFTGSAFAIRASDFEALGGFCADYTGRGLQDADLARVASEVGATLVRIGGATAYRQPVPAASPAEQVRHALRHIDLWRERWGEYPQHPWLDRLVAGGLLASDGEGYQVIRTA